MRRLPGILSLIVATLIVVVALLISGLRILMPYMNQYRTELLSVVSSATDSHIQAGELTGRWETFGPSVDIKDLRSTLDDGTTLTISHVRLALDVWQSLLHARLQFRDLTFWQLQLDLPSLPQASPGSGGHLAPKQLQSLFLRQFDHFVLRDSNITFPSPSGQQVQLAIPQLTWFNERKRHRAEGEVGLTSFTGQHGAIQVRLDLQDEKQLIDSGRIWLKADEVDVKPWLGRWMHDKTTLQSADFSLTAWINLKNGAVDSGDLQLSKGSASWQAGLQQHQLTVDDLTAHLSRAGKGWALSIPQTGIETDQQRWPQGQLSLYWQPEQNNLLRAANASEIRVRATHLDLQRMASLVPLMAPLAPELAGQWQSLQPEGSVDSLAIDFSLAKPQTSRFLASWHNLSWKSWKSVPAITGLSGSGSGSFDHGQLRVSGGPQNITVGNEFRAPLEMERFSGDLTWDTRDGNLLLEGNNLKARARSVDSRGDFRYQQPKDGKPRLDILAGINVLDAGDAWRYFPQNLMGKNLTDYLSGAIKGGTTRNATLIFAGNPHDFPFRHNEGMFQVSVPLKEATYAFQPGWPALNHLNIDLNFVNDGLWMKAPLAQLGNATAANVTADIPDYRQEKLIINGDITGSGSDIHDYFKHTPLAKSLAAALAQLQIKGDVSGHLNLDIPLNGKLVTATGNVAFNNNDLFIQPLKTTLKNLHGNFRYVNGALTSDPILAQWYGQPVTFNFSTLEQKNDFAVNVGLQSVWHPESISVLPAALRSRLKGNLPWKGNVDISLPYHGEASYKVSITGDAGEVSSHLPSPFDKPAGGHLPIAVNVNGNLQSFILSGSIKGDQHFVSRWLLTPRLRLDRGIWKDHTTKTPALPDKAAMVVNLPALNGEEWLGLLTNNNNNNDTNELRSTGSHVQLPGDVELHTPALNLGGQRWNDLTVSLAESMSGNTTVTASGKEIRGVLNINHHQPWRLNLDYLYYNPQSPSGSPLTGKVSNPSTLSFTQWPALQLNCQQCWFSGQNFGKISGSLAPSGNKLVLTNGELNAGHAKLKINGEWDNIPGAPRTALKGQLTSDDIGQTMQWFGTSTPVREAPLKLDYDLHWQNVPWKPEISTLSGILKLHTGKGVIENVSTGRAGQLLRLVSVDALLRKLSFDFKDTFSDKGFYFDSVNGTAWIQNGVLQTDNLLIDGLEADIAMKGQADFVRRRLDFEAVVAPELSASVGVATAFVINPVVGAAVFAASKVLAPLWNKISLLRYHIGGTMDDPQIHEVLRKPRTAE